MKTRDVAKAAKIDVGTLNVWIQRDLIPGVTCERSGIRRDFDIKTATHVVIMGELTRLGFRGPDASKWAMNLPALARAIEEIIGKL